MTDCAAPRHHDGEPAEADGYSRLCRTCRTRLRGYLRSIPELDNIMEYLLDPRNGITTDEGGTGGGLPVNAGAVEWRDQIRHDLETACCRVIGEKQTPTRPGPALPAMAGWLTGWADWLQYRDWAGHLAGALAESRTQAMRVIDPHRYPDVTIPANLNWCPGCETDNSLELLRAVHGEQRTYVVTCTACEQLWGYEHWYRLGMRIVRHCDAKTAA